ncbi:hypothetical protein U1Q18_051172, partial [Sarracenia purpurea var. burkii]
PPSATHGTANRLPKSRPVRSSAHRDSPSGRTPTPTTPCDSPQPPPSASHSLSRPPGSPSWGATPAVPLDCAVGGRETQTTVDTRSETGREIQTTVGKSGPRSIGLLSGTLPRMRGRITEWVRTANPVTESPMILTAHIEEYKWDERHANPTTKPSYEREPL